MPLKVYNYIGAPALKIKLKYQKSDTNLGEQLSKLLNFDQKRLSAAGFSNAEIGILRKAYDLIGTARDHRIDATLDHFFVRGLELRMSARDYFYTARDHIINAEELRKAAASSLRDASKELEAVYLHTSTGHRELLRKAIIRLERMAEKEDEKVEALGKEVFVPSA